MTSVEDLACIGWRVSDGFEASEKEDLYFENELSLEVLKKLLLYQMEWVGGRKWELCGWDGNASYVTQCVS